MTSLVCAAIVLSLVGRPSGQDESSWPAASTQLLVGAADRIIRHSNQLRQKQGLGRLQSNEQLTEAAVYFADYMARTGRFGHQVDGKRPAERAEMYGYEHCLLLENIGWQTSSGQVTAGELAERFYQGWRESPEHRRNMLDADVTEIGLGVARDETGDTFFAVQMLARPSRERIGFTVSNQSDSSFNYRVDDHRFTIEPRYRRTHQVCRPPEIEFELPDEINLEQSSADRTVQPRDGSRFVVRGDAEQGYTIETSDP